MQEPLYRSLLGPQFDGLPSAVQALHDSVQKRRYSGDAEVRPGTLWGRVVAWIIGFPTRAGRQPITVTFAPEGTSEQWTRDFNGHVLKSVQRAGTGRETGLLIERFGPVSVAIELKLRGNELHLFPRKWRVLGVPMPRWALPRGTSFETAKDDRFVFHVDVEAPLIGRIVQYRGWLAPVD